MLILSIDTSGKQGSIALARGGAASDDEVDVIERVPLIGGTFSAQLIPQIAELLAKNRFTRNDIDAFAVASGPGSFTGLRIGLAAVKGLAGVLRRPIAAVSLLQVCASGSGIQGKQMAALDAGRTDVYVGEYEDADGMEARERMLSRAEFLAQARGWTVATPDAALREAALAAGLSAVALPAISAAAVARLGWRKLLRGETVAPERLEANYIRRTDAEMLKGLGS
jgi:tRNA threonylcarbamoyladenosine biosynthesis protein TsaB